MQGRSYTKPPMERDDGRHTKLQQLPHSAGSFSLAAASAWPPPQVRRSPSSSHTCGYCRREFRSAQGLGGHMNVHRLDRARLIHHQCSSSSLHLALAPPPNPNPSRTVLDLLGSGCPCCRRTHGAAASSDEDSSVPAAKPGTFRFSSAPSATAKDFEGKNLEFGMGACSHGDGADEGLDLELRIGYSLDR